MGIVVNNVALKAEMTGYSFYGGKGINWPNALAKYGKRMPTVSEVIPAYSPYIDPKKNPDLLVELPKFSGTLSTYTRTFAFCTRNPLDEQIQGSGADGHYISVKWGEGEVRLAMDDQLLEYLKMQTLNGKPHLRANDIFMTIETSYTMENTGGDRYIIRIQDPKELAVCSLSDLDRREGLTSSFPTIFRGNDKPALPVALQIFQLMSNTGTMRFGALLVWGSEKPEKMYVTSGKAFVEFFHQQFYESGLLVYDSGAPNKQ